MVGCWSSPETSTQFEGCAKVLSCLFPHRNCGLHCLVQKNTSYLMWETEHGGPLDGTVGARLQGLPHSQ